MSDGRTVTIRGDEWSEDELRDLASRPSLDVPLKDEYGRRASLAVHVWQAQHEDEGNEPDEETAEEQPAPAEKPETAESDAPYIHAHPCPRCGDPVKSGRKNKLCDACHAKSRSEQVRKWKARKRMEKAAPDKERDGVGYDTINDSAALAVGTLARRLRRAVYAGDAKAYRATVGALADIDKVIAATGGWKEDKQ